MPAFRARHLVLASVFALVACGKKEDPGAPLAYVPADTPYVIANVEPVPDAIVAQWSKQMQSMWPFLAQSMETSLKRIESMPLPKDGAGEGTKTMQVVRALFDEFKTLDSIEKWQAVGFTPKAHSAVYGIGLVPVLRVELGNADAFRAFVARLETKTGTKLAVAKLDAQEYWLLGEGDHVTPVMAIEGNHFVLTVLPKLAPDALKRTLLGLTKPEHSLAESGALAKYNESEHYLPIGSGWIDFERIASLVTNGDPTLVAFATAVGEELPTFDDICKREIAALVAHAPRFGFGYRTLEPSRMGVHARLALDSELAGDLVKSLVPAPGAATDPNAIVDLSLSLPLLKVKELLARRVDLVVKAPYQCTSLVGLNAQARELKTKLDAFLPPPASDLLGARVTVTKLAIGTGMVPNVSGKMLVATSNPSFLLNMAQLAMPGFKDVKVAADGKPVALPATLFPMDPGGAWIAMNDKAIAIAVGPGEDASLGAYLAAPASSTPEILRMSYTGELYRAYGELFGKLSAMMPPEQRAEFEQQQRMFEFYRTWLKRGDSHLSVTPAGIEMDGVTEFNN